MDNNIVLSVRDLKTYFKVDKTTIKAIDGISFDLEKGKTLCLVGESGCGKSMTAFSIMGQVPFPGKVVGGEAILRGETDLLKIKNRDKWKFRGKDVGMIFQEPMTSLNPVKRIGWQVEESLYIHHPEIGKKERKQRAIEMLEAVGLNNAEEVYFMYPHELSGGMRQRVMIAAAMIGNPQILIADEPTTALDVTVQAQIVELLKKINRERGTSIIFISHDLSLVSQLCERVLVMRKGDIVESGPTSVVFGRPRHTYTKKLIAAIPKIDI